MKTNSLKHVLIKLSHALLFMCVSATCAWGQIINGNFEGKLVQAPSAIVNQMEANDWTFEKPVMFPVQWEVNPYIKSGEYKLINDPSLCHSGNICVYIKGDLRYTTPLKVNGGDEVKISFWVKDPAEHPVVGCIYLYDDEFSFLGDKNLPIISTKEWKECLVQLTVPAESLDPVTKEHKTVTHCVIALRSEKGAYFDDVSAERVANGQ